MGDSILEVKNLSKYFSVKGGFCKKKLVKAVNNLNFTIEKGKTLGLVGESGCGKTTAGRTIMRLEAPTCGQVLFDGHEIQKTDMKQYYRRMQMIYQDPYSSLDPRKTIREIVEEPLIIQKIEKDKKKRMEQVKEQLALVGINAEQMNRYPHEFSGGQRQRIAIARALVLKPDFIVCDEPVSALDVSIQAQVLNMLIRLQKELELTYLFIAHDLSVVRHISDTVAVMYMGSIVEMAETDLLFEGPCHPYTKALLSAIPNPDPQKSREAKRIVLQGDVPSPMNLPQGCAFCTRCPQVKEICRNEKPVYKQVGPNHSCACHLL